jgi:hypothetical protein
MAYDRLLAGETVSWLQILQDHPLLGSITVPKLVEAGVVQATPALDAMSATTDVWLTLQHRANGRRPGHRRCAGDRVVTTGRAAGRIR